MRRHGPSFYTYPPAFRSSVPSLFDACRPRVAGDHGSWVRDARDVTTGRFGPPEDTTLSEPQDIEATEAQEEAEEAPVDAQASPPPPPRLLRYLFFLVWTLVVPSALAIAAVRILEPEPFAADVGALRTFVGEQQVPATIIFFTVFAMVLWRARYALPFAASVGILGRRDVPRELRGKFDEAQTLLADARRVLEENRKAIAKKVKPKHREALVEALDRLEAVMDAEELDGKKLTAALAQAEQLVDKHIGAWRKGELREYTESIAVAFAVALILRFFVIEAFKIPSGSMIPTLMIGDHIFVAKYAYGPLLPRSDSRLYDALPPARGDVMVFKFPENEDQDFIKRVIALPGDQLDVVGGRPVLNGWLVPNCKVGRIDLPHGVSGHLYVEYLGEKTYLTMFDEALDDTSCKVDDDCPRRGVCRAGACGLPQGPFKVKADEAWVMGDNRNNSHDSRTWKGGLGAGVPFENIKGRAMFVWWSWQDGVAWDRIFVPVLGEPTLPPGASPELRTALEECIRNRPPVAETTPPSPR